MTDMEFRDLLGIYRTLFKRGWLTQMWLLPLFLTAAFGFVAFFSPIIVLGEMLKGTGDVVSGIIAAVIVNVAFWVGVISICVRKKALYTPDSFLVGTLVGEERSSYYDYSDGRRHTAVKVTVEVPEIGGVVTMSSHRMMGLRWDYFNGDTVYIACFNKAGKVVEHIMFKPEILRVEHRDGIFFLCGRSTYNKNQEYVRKLSE